ncbi:peptidoglycan editing factor PgeF [Oceanomicrobium pacificus]|uniref:Purine nucleoside phosphorylase n=1 Tax=Oceanomicrobium pacificus TaxID=2692916 RepID=A0A6B0TR41_9RHOB|nr:peptidoglycan editing factor PgeF [Oceanomicrobium pacificus]MXU64218.1 peptidoglycan editing factor PgeF [Oceanomicrobium pacificus]
MTLEILTSDLLDGVPHGFFTRRGGASSGIFSGLNCGEGSSDQSDIVAVNRKRVADAMQVEPAQLLSLHQVHSPTVAVVPDGGWVNGKPKADAMVTDRPGMALGILTADCAPILFSDPDAGIVAAAHAGWKGAVGGVIEATLAAMEDLGADRARTSAAIGPCISQRAYEVGPEFFDTVMAEADGAERFFAGGQGDRLMFDLPGFCLSRLRDADVGDATWIGHCTFTDPDRFYSYRRTTHAGEADYGRLISVIRI